MNNASDITPVQLDREASPRRSHKLPALVRDHDLDTRASHAGPEELEETEETYVASLNTAFWPIKMFNSTHSIHINFFLAKY